MAAEHFVSSILALASVAHLAQLSTKQASDELKSIEDAAHNSSSWPFRFECEGPKCKNEEYVRSEIAALSPGLISDVRPLGWAASGMMSLEFRANQYDGYWTFDVSTRAAVIKKVHAAFTWTAMQ